MPRRDHLPAEGSQDWGTADPLLAAHGPATIIQATLLLLVLPNSPIPVHLMISTRLPSLVDDLRTVVGNDGVLSAQSDLVVYECDGFVIEKNCPDVAVFPRTTQQVQAIVRVCNEYDVSFLPRGAGTSLAGGCLAGGRRSDDRAHAYEGDPRDQSPRPLRLGAARRRQRVADTGA